MNKLHKHAFSELYDISSGLSSTKEQAGHGAPFVSFSTVFNNYFLPDELPDLMDTSMADQEKYSVKRGDILITRTSETVDELAMSCVALKDYPKATFSGFVKRLRPKEKSTVYDKYMAFFLRSEYFRNVINAKTIMTLRASFNEDIFSYLDLYLPNYEEQVKIGDFLYSIEKKIQCNNTINDNLQHQLNLLYNYWFTQFDFPDENGKPYRSSGGTMVWNKELKCYIPKKWTSGSVSDCVEKISTGLNPRDNFVLGNGNINYITVKNLTTSGGLDFSGCDMIDEEARAIVHRRSDICIGDILFASISPLGRCFLIQQEPTDWDINESVFSIRSKTDVITPEFLYLFFQSDNFIRKATNTSTGSIFKGIRISTLLDTQMIIPDIQICKKFTNAIKPLLAQINIYSSQNAKLSSLRDWLLPMLINGQINFIDEQQEIPIIKESGFKRWISNQGFAARGDVDMDVLRDIYEAMDNDDK